MEKSSIWITCEEDVVEARHEGRIAARNLGFSSVEQGLIVLAISELARNIYIHAGNGEICICEVHNSNKIGLQITATDHGPGMNIRKALHYDLSASVSGCSGLTGVKVLMDEFDINSSPEQGTQISAIKWLVPIPIDKRKIPALSAV